MATLEGTVGPLGFTIQTEPCSCCGRSLVADVGMWLKEWAGKRVRLTVEEIGKPEAQADSGAETRILMAMEALLEEQGKE